MQMLICLMFSQRSLKRSPFNFFLFVSFGCSDWVNHIVSSSSDYSTIPSFRSLMHSSGSLNLLSISSSIFFIAILVSFSSNSLLYFLVLC